MLSQFTPEHGNLSLKDIKYNFPVDAYPVGRLDKDSEGLLVLTNDKALNHWLLDPSFQHKREYWVQVEGIPTPEALHKLEEGIMIEGYKTLPAIAKAIEPPVLPDRDPPIRVRKTVPDSWISLTLTEGKNRQVRRMSAAVGYPTLRLIRARIEDIYIEDMRPGEVRELKKDEVYNKLFIKNH